jgi:GNAT superfamily N-acetyltransferase
VPDLDVVELTGEHRAWADRIVREVWGAPIVVSRGRVHNPADLPGFVVLLDGSAAGFATYAIDDRSCELVTIDSLIPDSGVGSALVEAVRSAARRAGCNRLWLVTTNDNTHALRFYQRRGFVLAGLHRDAVADSRRLKPEIAERGHDGIPIRDELELELRL